MSSAWHLDEGGGDVNLVTFVVNSLNATLSCIVLIPAVAMEALVLLAGVAETWGLLAHKLPISKSSQPTILDIVVGVNP